MSVATTITLPNSLADWSSILGFLWAIAASVIAGWQRHMRNQETKAVVSFLHGLKPAIQGENRPLVIEQIDDQLMRLDPKK
jgi:hypothetical protein